MDIEKVLNEVTCLQEENINYQKENPTMKTENTNSFEEEVILIAELCLKYKREFKTLEDIFRIEKDEYLVFVGAHAYGDIFQPKNSSFYSMIDKVNRVEYLLTHTNLEYIPIVMKVRNQAILSYLEKYYPKMNHYNYIDRKFIISNALSLLHLKELENKEPFSPSIKAFEFLSSLEGQLYLHDNYVD